MSGDMFGYVKPRAGPRVMMHAVDVGEVPGGKPGAHFACQRCEYDDGWSETGPSVTEVRRGKPCPRCNASTPPNRDTDEGN